MQLDQPHGYASTPDRSEDTVLGVMEQHALPDDRVAVILAGLPYGTAVLDRRGTILAVNEAWQRCARGDGNPTLADCNVGQNYLEVCWQAVGASAEGSREVGAGIQAVLEARQTLFTYEYPCHSPSERRWFLLHVAPLSGAPGGAVVSHIDITERKQTEEERAQPVHSRTGADGRFRAMVELAPDATVVADHEGHIALVNRQVERLFGYAREDLLGQPVELLIPERFHDAHHQHRTHYVAAPRTRPMGSNLQLSGRRRDGSEFPVEVSLSPLDDAGEFLVIASIRDVSERQRLEVARAAAEAASEELRRLQAITDTALTHRDLDELVQALLDRIRAVMAVDNVAILLASEDGQELALYAAQGPEEAAVVEHLRMPVGQGVARRIAATRQPLIVEDLAAVEVVNPLLREHLRSLVGVPLLVDDRLIGVMHADSATPRRFTEDDARLLQLVAERIAYVLDYARLYSAEQAARREAEAALARARVSETQFQRLVEANIIGIVVEDTERIIEANDAFLRLLGYTREDLLAGRLRRDTLTTPQTFAATERAVQEALTRGACEPFEREYVRQDGSRVPALVGVALLERNPVRFVSFVLDLTERKQAEEALRGSEERFRTMADTAPVLLWVADTDGLVTFVNAPWLRFTGRSIEQELGNGWADGVHPDDYHRCLETYRTAFRARQSFTMEYRLRRFDGEYRWIVDSGVPRFAPDGSFLGYIGSAIDITERERLKQEREEARASERAQLEMNRHMEQFLATAAHDLRQPVMAADFGVELAQRRVQRLAAAIAPASPAGGRPTCPYDDALAALQALEHASQATQRLSRFINHLFDVAQARTGKLELTPTACDLAALVREYVGALRATTPERTIRLKLPTGAAVSVVADADRVGQVITNYLTNALKYAPPDRPVDVALEVDEGRARVAVRDEGPGLPLEEQDRVWEMFHRVPGIETQGGASEGLGLGLHICKTIVERHGGQVGVESVVGQGCTFWFTLPLASAIG